MTDFVKIVLADTKGPFSTLIKLNTWSQWSHSALLITDGAIQESTIAGGGVHYSSLQSLKDRSHKGVILKVPVKDSNAVYELSKKIDGLPYDIRGVFGIGVHRDWQESDMFWCSEATYYCIHLAGNEYYRAEALHRVTPEDLWKLNFEIVETF